MDLDDNREPDSQRKDSDIKPASQELYLPIYMPCAPYVTCPPIPNLPFPDEYNWSYTAPDCCEQLPVVPDKKPKVEPGKKPKVEPGKKPKVEPKE